MRMVAASRGTTGAVLADMEVPMGCLVPSEGRFEQGNGSSPRHAIGNRVVCYPVQAPGACIGVREPMTGLTEHHDLKLRSCCGHLLPQGHDLLGRRIGILGAC